MNEVERDELIARVGEDLAEHAYTELVNGNGVEVWRCARPGSSNYGFDICVTRFGMSMMGDIGPLVFSVGSLYGINFLRHQSDGYLYGKLDSDIKRQVIDFDAIRETVCSCIVGRIEKELETDEIPEWMVSIPDKGATLHHAEQLIAWMHERADDDERLPYSDLIDALEEVETFAEGRDAETVLAYDFLHQYEEVIGGSELWETTISKPCPNLVARLYYLRHAANAIMSIKEAQAAA